MFSSHRIQNIYKIHSIELAKVYALVTTCLTKNSRTMKKVLSILICTLCLSSCGTLFTPTKQAITFIGTPEARIYDNGKILGQIEEDGTAIIKIRKKLSNKTLIAKKRGYKNTPIVLETTLNPVSIINLTNIFAWIIDLGTGKCCKWDSDIIEFEMERAKTWK